MNKDLRRIEKHLLGAICLYGLLISYLPNVIVAHLHFLVPFYVVALPVLLIWVLYLKHEIDKYKKTKKDYEVEELKKFLKETLIMIPFLTLIMLTVGVWGAKMLLQHKPA